MIQKNLLEKHPDVAKFWHPTKNGNLTPEDVLSQSHQKVWWRCRINPKHEFIQRIAYQIKSKKCPICSGKKLGTDNSLLTLYPEVAKYWHPTKNGDLTPDKVRPGNSTLVWWQCPDVEDHIYQTQIRIRVRYQTTCPICSGRKFDKNKSLSILFPSIAAEWDHERNGNLKPEYVSAGSAKNVWWICKNNSDHRWQSRIHDRARGSGCPTCNKPIPNKLASLSIARPDLLKDWDYERNIGIDPTKVRAGSSKRVWWKCEICGHKWETTVNNRARKERRCTECNKKSSVKDSNLESYKPEIAAEWHPTLNGILKPKDFSYGSGKKVWWICTKNSSHYWKAMIRDRTKLHPNKCPHCVTESTKNFLDTYPELANEWHPTKNLPLVPTDVSPHSNKKVWWICSRDSSHEWDAVIKNRTILKSGCPICNKEKSNIATTLKIIDAIISSSEFYENYRNGIDSLVKLLNIKIWDRKLKRAFRKMIYANIVTIMEAYLSDTFIKTVLSDVSLQRKFIESNPNYHKEKIEISNVYNWLENVIKNINDELIDITYHNIWKIQKLYKSVLGIDFPEDLTDIQQIILFRHDLIHRDGKTKDGDILNVTLQDIKNAVEIINEFVSFLERQFALKFSNNP